MSKTIRTFTELVEQIWTNSPNLQSIKLRWLTYSPSSPTNDIDYITSKLILLCQALKDNTHIIKLEIIGCRIGEDIYQPTAETIGDLISRNRYLHTLVLSHNYLRSPCAEWISSALTSCDSRLVRLDLSNNKLGIESTTHLAQALPHSSLKYLDLSYNFIGLPEAKRLTTDHKASLEEHTPTLAQILQMLFASDLEELKLQACNIDNEAVTQVGQSLTGKKIVRILDIQRDCCWMNCFLAS